MTARKTETRTLHFDLSHSPPGVVHTLHLAGRHHLLAAHTPQTRAAFREKNRLLQHVPDQRLTHYLENVPVLSGAIQSYSITHPPAVGTLPNLALMGIMVPKEVAKLAHQRHGPSRGLYNAKARRLGLLTSTPQGGEAGPAFLNDGDLADFVDMTEAATAIVYHHPGLLTLSSSSESSEGSLTAVQIIGLIQATPHFQITDPQTGDVTGGLVFALQQQGLATHLKKWNKGFQGWSNAVAWTDASGNPVVDKKGQPRWWYQHTQETSDAMTPVVQESLLAVQNQANLDGIAFKTNFGLHAQTDTPQAPMLVRRKAHAPSLAAAADASGLQVMLSDTDWNFGRRVSVSQVQGRDITFTVENSYFRHMGIFVRFVDGQDPPQPLLLSGLTPSQPSTPNDTDYDRFVGFLGPRNRILGVPIQDETSTDLTVTLPDQASGMQILVGSLGHGPPPSSVDTYQSVHIPGAVVTGVLDIGLPSFFLLLGATADMLDLSEGQTLVAALVSWILETFAQEVAISAFPSGDVSKTDLQTEWAGNVLKSIITEAPAVFTQLIEWAMKVAAVEEALEWVPIVGQIIEAANTAGTLAEITETVVDVLLSPWVVPDTLQTQMEVDVTVTPGNNFEFPASATQLKVIATPSNSIPQIFSGTLSELFPDYPQVPSLQASFTVPSGGEIKIDVTLTADNGWVAASGSLGPVDNLLPQDAGALALTVPLVQNPLPLSSNTQYQHLQKLGVDGSGAHAWTTTSTPPQATAASLGGNTQLQLNDVNGITINMNGRLGYVWRATSPTLMDANGSGGSQQLFTLQNINLDSSAAPDSALRILGSASNAQQAGFEQPIFMAYDLSGPTTGGVNYIVAPAQDPETGAVEYHAFQVDLDGTSAIDLSTAKSWGRFASPTLDAVAVHPRGVIVALSAASEKVELLTLPAQPYDSLSDAEYAGNQVGGLGQYIGRLHGSAAIAITKDGNTFLVLESVNNRIQAFSINGTSVQYFGDQPWIPLTQPMDEGKQIAWLSMSLESTGFIYVLSSESPGNDPSQYRLDIYDPSGQWLARTTGVPAGRLAVDAMRAVWTLNYELIQGPDSRPEPSVSQWAGTSSSTSGS